MHQYATLMHILSTIGKRHEMLHDPGRSIRHASHKRPKRHVLASSYAVFAEAPAIGIEDSAITDLADGYAVSTSSDGGGTNGNGATVARAPSDSEMIVSGAATSR